MTVSDIVSRETPPKNEAAPINAMAPGSIQEENGSSSGGWIPNHVTII